LGALQGLRPFGMGDVARAGNTPFPACYLVERGHSTRGYK